jgi:hemoglobin/transferrin/lactoferrin receptor protein
MGLVFQKSLSQNVLVLDKDTRMSLAGVIVSGDHELVQTNIDGVASLDLFDDDELLTFRNNSYNELKILKSEVKNVNYIIYLIGRVDLDEVVISASKFEQSSRDIPQKIVNISAKEIQFTNPQTSADLLENTGNVYVQKSQLGGGSPMIRGFSTNRLLITVDGVRMNNAIFRSGNLQNVISIDPFSIQNTEITLGAGSVVYGSDAIGGVMSFYTKKPQLSYKDDLYIKANALMRYASANFEKTGHLDINMGLKKWAFLTSFSFSDYDNLRMGNYGPEEYLRHEYVETTNGMDSIVTNENPLIQNPTGFSQYHLMQKIRYEPKEDLSLDLGFYFSRTSDFSRYDRLLRYRGDVLRSAEWNYGPQQWFMTSFQYTKLRSSSNLYDKVQTTVAYQNFQESRYDRNFDSVIENIREEAVDALSFNVDLEKQISSKTELFYGFEYVYNMVSSGGEEKNIISNSYQPTVSRYPDGSKWQSMALYTSLKYKPNAKFVFQSGIRYNQIFANANFVDNNQYLNLPFESTKINSGALTGTAGVSWIPSETVQWKLNASTAFRAPNIDDVGKVFDSEPGSVVVPNDNLKPEYAYGGELGLLLNFDNVLVLDLATYYTFLDNALVRRDYAINGDTEIIYDGELSNVQAIQNASKAWIYGFEVGLKIHFSDRLKCTSQYNIIGGSEDENGSEIPVRHVAPNFGNTHLIFDYDRLKIDGFIDYNGELSHNQLAPSEVEKDYLYAKDDNGNPYAPSWYTLNLRTQYALNNSLFVTLGLENITDQRYRKYSSGIASPGRNLVVSLSYSL